MRTIPRRFPGRTIAGRYRDICVVCMCPYYRDKLIRRPDGNLVCIYSCSKGREPYEQGLDAAQAARTVGELPRNRRGYD